MAWRCLLWYLVLSMLIVSVAPRAEASFAGSRAVSVSDDDREREIGQIQRFLETRIVETRLQELGFTATEIQSRLSSLSDQQIHKLALQMEELKTGGAGEGLLIGILIIILVIGVVLPLLGIRVWR